jgi:glycosyltransferase involved in cell wall biosynthesis
MERPKLSVIIPVHNAERYIGRLLNSIEIQNRSKVPTEVIFCDDCSTDRSEEIAHQHDDNLNIVYCKTGEHDIHCPGNTRQDALQYVTGEWVTGIDNDDEFEPDAFEKVFDYIEKTGETMMVCANFRGFHEDGSLIKEHINTDTWTHGKFFNMDNLVHKYDIHYKENMFSHEDVYFNSMVLGRLIGMGRDYNYLNEFVYRWTWRPDSLSHSYTDEKHKYIETYLNDYIIACSEPFLDYLGVYPLATEFYVNQLMMCVLHAYFYQQAAVYRLGWDDEIVVKNDGNIRVLILKICGKLHVDPNYVINYIYNLPERYNKIKGSCFEGSNPFIETLTFEQFITRCTK